MTIGVLTKARPNILKQCLQRIALQTKIPEKVIVLDNDSKKSAQSIVKIFSSILEIKYLHLPSLNVAQLRNRIIKESDGQYLGFVDDDCLITSRWVENSEKLLNSLTTVDFIIGKTKLANPLTAVARAEYVHHQFWFEKKLVGKSLGLGRTTDPFNFDTKNLVIRRSVFSKNKIKFDIKLSKENGFDVSDTDLGFQLQQLGLIGIYCQNLIGFHFETESLIGFVKKSFRKSQLWRKIAQKWKLKNEFVNLELLNFRALISYFKEWPKEFRDYSTELEKIGRYSEVDKVKNFGLIKLKELASLFGYVSF